MLGRTATLVATVALVSAACGPAPSGSPLADARDLLDHSVVTLRALHTAHAHIELAGRFSLDLEGSGNAKVVDLAGATAEADIDMTNDRGKVSFAIPSYLDFGGDIIQIGPERFVRTGVAGKYTMSIDVLPVPMAAIGQLQGAIRTLADPPVRGADERCGQELCYEVTATLEGIDLSGTGLPVSGTATGTTTLEILVRQSDARPVRIAAVYDDGSAGKLWATVTLSAFDAPVSVEAPPPEQVVIAPPAASTAPSTAP